MTGAGALTIREVARRVNRDVEAVYHDAYALPDAGLPKSTGAGRLLSPYARVCVEFDHRLR